MANSTQWEYRMVTAHARAGGFEELTAAGHDGWEAVAMSPLGAHLIVLLKRPIAPSPS